MNLSDREISVVVQGPVVGKAGDPEGARITLRSLASVRKQWPNAELILSTWKGSDVSGLPFDVLVENDDPGALPVDVAKGVPNNVNRQLLTTQAGLRASTRRYVLKMRSDMEMRHSGLTKYLNGFTARSDWSFVHNRVVASTVYARIPGLVWHLPYHPGDWFFFGEKRDVLEIWDIPLARAADVSMGMPDLPGGPNLQGMLDMLRCAPEQYIWLSFLRKHREVKVHSHWDRTPESIAGTEKSFAANLVLISPAAAGFASLKYQNPPAIKEWAVGSGSCYTHTLWKHLYFKHCLARPRTIYALGWTEPYLAKSVYIARRLWAPISFRKKK
jgi:hypothetical protein